jgi:hypothetical protein
MVWTADAPVARYQFLGRTWSIDDDGIEAALAQVHASNVSSERPRCLCMPGGVDMVVVRLPNQFILKRMPKTGAQHHASCMSYEPGQQATGLGELLGDAVVEVDSAKVDVRVSFSMSRTSGEAGGRARAGESGVVKPKSDGVSLRALLHLLFNKAGFDRWSPGMEGKRSQWVIHKYVMQAASIVFVKGFPVADRLYVPEQFSQVNRAEVAMRRRQKFAALYPCDGVYPLGLLIGEFKSSDLVAGHRLVWIKHMPDAPFVVKAATWQRIEKKFGKLFDAKLADGGAMARLILCALIRARSEQSFEIDSATMMLTTAQWIPVDEVYELDLIQDLVSKGRRFWKPLRYDARSDRVFANALLLDRGPSPVPLYGLSPFMSPKQRDLIGKEISKTWPQVEVWDSVHMCPTKI